MTVIEKIQSMIAKSNDTTGLSDTDLTTAITNLCAGYGGGLPSNVYVGTTTTPATLHGTKFITTGFAPKIVGAWCHDDINNLDTYSVIYGIYTGAQNGFYFQDIYQGSAYTRTYTANNTTGATGHIIGTSNTGFTIQTLENFFAGKEMKLIAIGQ